MKQVVLLIVCACAISVAQDASSPVRFPFHFPVFVAPMPNSFDVALRNELEAQRVFKQLVSDKVAASLIIAMKDNEIVFTLADGNPYGNGALTLSDGNLNNLRRGRSKDIAKGIAEAIKANVNPWLFRSERELLAELGNPYTLVSGEEGGKSLIWPTKTVYVIRGQEKQCGMTAPDRAEKLPALPIKCSMLYDEAGHFPAVAYDVNADGIIYSVRNIAF